MSSLRPAQAVLIALLSTAGFASAQDKGDAEFLKKLYATAETLPQKAYGAQLNAKAVLESDETWTPENVYLVFGTFSTGAHSLTIQAGTIVLFTDDPTRPVEHPPGTIRINEGGAIRVLGTPEKHVTLASMNNEELFWDGLTAGFGYKEFTVENTDFYKAGCGGGIAAIGTLRSPTEPAIKLKNVTFHRLQVHGLTIWNETGLTADSKVTIFDYDAKNDDPHYQYHVVDIDPVAAGTLSKEVLTVKEGVPVYARVIYISTPMVLKSVTWRDCGIPYRVLEVQVPGDTYGGKPVTLTIEAGCTIQVGNIIYVGGKTGTGETDMGNLVAVGTKEKPILFTSASMEAHKPGDWQSIFFRAGSFDTKVTKLEYCILEYGGSSPTNTMWHDADGTGNVGSEIAIMSWPKSEPYDGPSITHTTFRKSAGQGVRARTMGPYKVNQDYTDPAMGNTFEDFADPSQRQLPNKKD